MLFPCKDCEDRYPGCHSSCDVYKRAKGKHDYERLKDRDISSYEQDFHKKCVDYEAKQRKRRR